MSAFVEHAINVSIITRLLYCKSSLINPIDANAHFTLITSIKFKFIDPFTCLNYIPTAHINQVLTRVLPFLSRDCHVGLCPPRNEMCGVNCSHFRREGA